MPGSASNTAVSNPTNDSKPDSRAPKTTSLDKITPPTNLSKRDKRVVFDYIFRQLARFRNTASLYADLEARYEFVVAATNPSPGLGQSKVSEEHVPEKASEDAEKQDWKMEYDDALKDWAQKLLQNAWVACTEEDEGKCPILDPYSDTSVRDLVNRLPSPNDISQLVNTTLFLHITTTKGYSALTRAFLFQLLDQLNQTQTLTPKAPTGAPPDSEDGKQPPDHDDNPPEPEIAQCHLDEDDISWTLKNPETAIDQAQKQADQIASEHAQRSKTLRNIAVSVGGIAGGVLIGVTGGLAAPLVGAGVAAILGVIGLGGSIIGLIATGLAGSAVICGALFGVYGAHSTAVMVERHTREVRDLAIVPVRRGGSSSSSRRNSCDGDQKEGVQKEACDGSEVTANKESSRDTLAVRLCISGWLNDRGDVTAPWTVFEGDDTYALQWEIEALEELSNALSALLQAEAIKYVKGEVIKRTFLAGIMSSLAPLALLRIGQIIDNPWMNARARGIKAGAVLGDLLAQRVLGNRPVTLVGYSLGSLVIYEALLELASRAPAETLHLVQDVYIFGAPVPADQDEWTKIRRVVAGRVVNGYSGNDYVLAVLSRAADARWNVAGLEPVDVKGVENMDCSEVHGHTAWRGLVGKYLEACHAPGV